MLNGFVSLAAASAHTPAQDAAPIEAVTAARAPAPAAALGAAQ